MARVTGTLPTLESIAGEARPSTFPRPSQGQMMAGDLDDTAVCWVCMEDSNSTIGELRTPCKCTTRPAHAKCLARWQLQAAGRKEENVCRFCNIQLPDWRDTLAPLPTAKAVRPIMAVRFQGKLFRLRVDSGPEGLQQFKEQIKKLLGFEITDGCEVDFECKVPSTGERVKLTGIGAYSAATHCAAVSAAERKLRALGVRGNTETKQALPAPTTRSTSHNTLANSNLPPIISYTNPSVNPFARMWPPLNTPLQQNVAATCPIMTASSHPEDLPLLPQLSAPVRNTGSAAPSPQPEQPTNTHGVNASTRSTSNPGTGPATPVATGSYALDAAMTQPTLTTLLHSLSGKEQDCD